MSLRCAFALYLISSVLVLDIRGTTIKESFFNLGPRLFNHRLMEDSNVGTVPDNLIASPLGLGLGLALIESAASHGLQRLILDELFGWHGEEGAFRGNLTAIQNQLKAVYQKPTNRSNSAIGENVDVTVNLQSVIFKQEGVEFKEDFQRTLEAYQAEVISLNRSLSTTDRQFIINKWARNATRDLIREFPVPDKFTVLLANTVFFEGDWVEPFSSQYTRKGIFKPSTDSSTHLHNVMYLMGQKEDSSYYEDDHMQMLKLPYNIKDRSKADVAMFVLLPKKDKKLTDLINRVSFTIFRDIVRNKMTSHTVNVKMPKVTLQHRINVKEMLESLKEQRSRRWKRSIDRDEINESPVEDFFLSGASSNPNFVLTEFVQNTVLEINEKGTRAAALTGGTINYDGLKKNFRCDRPYLTIIYDNQQEVVLFWATVYKPSPN